MKVCPECQARFVGSESFCPNDATPLVDARELSPGELTGTDLNAQIHLERLEFADRLGERYAGEFRPEKTPLRVTVFNQGFVPEKSRLAALGEGRLALGEFLPAEILSLHSLSLEGERPFLAEEAPAGPSLKQVIEERKALDWQTAARITCNVGRALEYLAERDLIYLGLHAGAIFVTDLKRGQIQLGEWAHSLLSHPQRPLELDEAADNTFLGYSGCLAPEAIRDAADADQRSLVYSLAMLLYQLIVGKPPFTSKETADSLKRHLHEKPLKLSIARGVAGLPADIDDILDMMWIKAPERRFQKISAACAAIASLFDEQVENIAPALVPAERAVFEEPEAQPEDARAQAAPEDKGYEKRTIMGMPAVALTPQAAGLEEGASEEPAGADDAAEASDAQGAPTAQVVKPAGQKPAEGPSIIIDDPELRAAAILSEPSSQADEKPAQDMPAKHADKEAAQDIEAPADEAAKSTLMMGAIDTQAGSKADKEAAPDQEEAPEARAAEQEEALDEGLEQEERDKEKEDIAQPAGEADRGEEKEEPAKGAKGEEASDKALKDDEKVEEALDEAQKSGAKEDEASEDTQAEAPAKALSEAQDDEAEEASGEEPAKDESAQESLAPEKDEAAGVEQDVEESADDAQPGGGLNIGFVETANDGGGEFAESWFGADADDAWERSQVEEHLEHAENRLKYVIFAAIGALAIGAVAFIAWVQLHDPDAADEQDRAALEEQEEAERRQTRLERASAGVSSALDSGHLIRPRRDSAVSRLERLKTLDREGESYNKLRSEFVQKAMLEARKNEDDDLDYAVDLAGYAAQFAKGDATVNAYADELRQRQAGAQPDAPPQKSDEDDPASGDGSEDKSEKEQSASAKKPATADPKTPVKSTQGASQPAAKKDRTVNTILSEARAALSKNNTDQAARLYREALTKDGNNAAANAGLGDLLFNQAQHAEALDYQKKALQLAPKNVNYAINLGKTYFRMEKYADAQKVWKQAQANDPNNATVEQHLKLVEGRL